MNETKHFREVLLKKLSVEPTENVNLSDKTEADLSELILSYGFLHYVKEQMPKLKVLKLRRCEVSLVALQSFDQLEELYASECHPAYPERSYNHKEQVPPVDISPITKLITLQRLDLSGYYKQARIFQGVYIPSPDEYDYAPWLAKHESIPNYAVLYIKLSNIEPLANLTKLTHLYLASNDIEDIDCLLKLPNLRYLDIANNPVCDPRRSRAVFLTLEKRGVEINLQSKPTRRL